MGDSNHGGSKVLFAIIFIFIHLFFWESDCFSDKWKRPKHEIAQSKSYTSFLFLFIIIIACLGEYCGCEFGIFLTSFLSNHKHFNMSSKARNICWFSARERHHTYRWGNSNHCGSKLLFVLFLMFVNVDFSFCIATVVWKHWSILPENSFCRKSKLPIILGNTSVIKYNQLPTYAQVFDLYFIAFYCYRMPLSFPEKDRNMKLLNQNHTHLFFFNQILTRANYLYTIHFNFVAPYLL